jgi:adenylate cyclase
VEYQEPLGDAMLKKLKRQIELASSTPNSVDIIRGTQHGIWGLFADMIVVSWVYSASSAEYADQANQDATSVAGQLTALLKATGLPESTPVRYTEHHGTITADQPAAPQWRSLLAQAVIKLESAVRS